MVNCAKIELKSRETEPRKAAAEAEHGNGGSAGEKGWASRVRGYRQNITAALWRSNQRLETWGISPCPGGKARLGVSSSGAEDSAREEWMVSHGGDPTVNSWLLIAPEAAQRSWLFSEAAGIPWLGSSTKPDSARGAVLTVLGRDTAQPQP